MQSTKVIHINQDGDRFEVTFEDSGVNVKVWAGNNVAGSSFTETFGGRAKVHVYNNSQDEPIKTVSLTN